MSCLDLSLECLIPDCDVRFVLDTWEEQQVFLKHLLEQHKLVISEVKLVADLKRYIQYWRERFASASLIDFCPVIRTNSDKSAEKQKDFYLLCDALEEDKILRTRLQQERLNEVLDQHTLEREDETFSRGCLFCRKIFEGNRSVLFEHLSEKHNFFLGLPDNIVYCREFLDVLEDRIDKCICLYCEKVFKDRNIVKEHMRKKQHKRLNPKNPLWDKFYLINYLELGKNWEQIQQEPDELAREETEEEKWSDWEDLTPSRVLCLFCSKSMSEVFPLEGHMIAQHDFNFREVINTQDLNFYQKVKLVNFIRRQVCELTCIFCQTKLSCSDELLSHMSTESHFKLPCSEIWNQPQYYFPTQENDQLLCTLHDDLLDSENSVVVPDDEP